MSDVDQTLKERGSRYNLYGKYEDHARLTQAMKELCRAHKGWSDTPPEMQEALDMILHKIARVLNGDHSYKDNWVDIEGYSRLVSRALDTEGNSSLETSSPGLDPVTVVPAMHEPLTLGTLTDNLTNMMRPHDDGPDAWRRWTAIRCPTTGDIKGWIFDP